jgi:hypothetical protein
MRVVNATPAVTIVSCSHGTRKLLNAATVRLENGIKHTSRGPVAAANALIVRAGSARNVYLHFDKGLICTTLQLPFWGVSDGGCNFYESTGPR